MTPLRREVPLQPDDDFFDALDGPTGDRSPVEASAIDEGVASAMADWTRPKKPAKKAPARVADRAFEKAREEASDRSSTGEWAEANPIVFVALQALLFAKVYGFEPSDLTPKSRVAATAMAKRLILVEFGGNAEAMAEYMKWSWGREKGREAWRRANGREGRPIGWTLMFGGALLNEYRLALSRQRTRPTTVEAHDEQG